MLYSISLQLNFLCFSLILVAVADMLMGIYLFTIAIQDLRYREMYHQYSHEWTSSLGCTLVGVVAMTSTEVGIAVHAAPALFNQSVCHFTARLTINFVYLLTGLFALVGFHVDGTVPMYSLAFRLH